MSVSGSPRRRARPLAVAVVLCASLVGWSAGAALAANVTTQISVVDSHGNGIAGVPIHYTANPNSGWYYLGTTDSSGQVDVTAPAGSYQLMADYNQGESITSSAVDISQPYTFRTVQVTLLNSGLTYATDAYSGWHTYAGPMQMFPGTYLLNDSHGNVSLAVGATDFTGGIVRLVDHTGAGLAGGTVSYYLNGWNTVPGQTDANGNLLVSIPSGSPYFGYLYVGMTYAGTYSQQSLTQLASSNFTFQTALAVVRLDDADGNPLDTGSASYYAGGWRSVGSGSTSGGVVTQEMLPGSYSFAMSYNGTRQQLDSVAISGPSTTVTFQTGRLTLAFSGGIQYSWAQTGYSAFTKPTMEFLPGSVQLNLNSGYDWCTPSLFTIAAGDHVTLSGIFAKLTGSGGLALAGGVATAYVGGWQSVGTTGSNGVACAMFPGTLGNTAVAMAYNGSRQQITQYQPTNSVYTFGAADVTVKLEDASGNPLDTGTASYYAGGWHTIGNTSGGAVDVQLLPGSYSFAMTYNGTREQFNNVAVSGTATTVTFQTGSVLSTTGTATAYYAGGWVLFSQGAQLLPGTYTFGFNDGTPNTAYTITAAVVNGIH